MFRKIGTRYLHPDLARLGVTPSEVFLNRRELIATLGLSSLALGGGALGGGALSAQAPSTAARTPLDVPLSRPNVFPAKRNGVIGLPKEIPRKSLTEREVAATHNNFYEFLPGRGGEVWQHTADFVVEPWKVEVTGACEQPQTFDLDALFGFPHEERVYHFRCVERWAMNIPWSGFPLRLLLDKVQPKAGAKYVRFVSAQVTEQMPGVREAHWYPWPYFEALRLDEAMNELAFVVTGVYGLPLVKQHGAPVRIAVPWKYGYKSPKSIVRIELVGDQPKTFWQIQPHEYGFLSNINLNIPHPRWSQAQSFWLGSEEPFATPIFNGYGDYVAKLYPDEPTTPQRPLVEGQVAR
jgi:sulfoxide reductase catalytic subunit YedY